MWKIHRRTPQLIVASALMMSLIGDAYAQTTSSTNNTGSINNAFQLPGVSLPSGSDEVRAADGTSCRSAVGGSGAYLDIGVIGNPNGLTNSGTSATQSAYGRLVVPLGRRAKRVDCTRLYDLEVRRLEMELKLMEMGLGRPVEGTAASDTSETASNDEFSDDGWSNDGL